MAAIVELDVALAMRSAAAIVRRDTALAIREAFCGGHSEA